VWVRAATAQDAILNGLTIEQLLSHGAWLNPKSGHGRAALLHSPCPTRVEFDLKLPSTLDILVCQPTITDEFSRNLQFNGPQTEPELVLIPEIPLDPCPHVVGIRHFRVKGSGIRIDEYLLQCSFVVQTVGT
jgi:hypothetical protein